MSKTVICGEDPLERSWRLPEFIEDGIVFTDNPERYNSNQFTIVGLEDGKQYFENRFSQYNPDVILPVVTWIFDGSPDALWWDRVRLEHDFLNVELVMLCEPKHVEWTTAKRVVKWVILDRNALARLSEIHIPIDEDLVAANGFPAIWNC